MTEEVENEQGEPYFYRNVMKKVATKKKKETMAARAENNQAKALFRLMKQRDFELYRLRNTLKLSQIEPYRPLTRIRSEI